MELGRAQKSGVRRGCGFPEGEWGGAGLPGGVGSQDPGEPLTYDPEVCLVTSRECLQGQIPQPWVPGPQAQLQLWVRPGVGPVQGGAGVLIEV